MAYADAAELARILNIGNPSAAQADALQRVLDAAATEIEKWLGLAEPLTEPYPPLVVSVNLDWASDLWKTEQAPYGIVLLGGESPPGYPSKNVYRRHQLALLPLKESWGVG